MDLKSFKNSFNKELNALLDYKLTPYQKLEDQDIKEHLNYLKDIFSEGKRIRPYLAYLSYKSVGGTKDTEAIKLFVFIELFHVFALIHDDVMDNADQRHGIRTINKYVADKYSKNKIVDPKHFGEANAIMVGDFLFAWANEILLSNKDFNKEAIQRVYETYSQMINDVFLGQMIDLSITTKKSVTDKEIFQKYLLKTAKYSFIGPLMIGAKLENENVNESFYEEFGKYLGLAFQIQDDLMDIKYDEKQIGKTAFNDIEQHQHTIFTNYVFKNGTKNQKETLNSLFRKKLTDADKSELRTLFNKSGAIDYGEKLIKENIDNAKKILKKQNMDTEYKKLFLNIISKLSNRPN